MSKDNENLEFSVQRSVFKFRKVTETFNCLCIVFIFQSTKLKVGNWQSSVGINSKTLKRALSHE